MSLIILQQVIIMSILMGIGYFLFKKEFITKVGSKELGSMLVYVVIPTVIIRSFLVEFSTEKLNLFFMSTLLAFICFLISMTISYFVFKNDPVSNFGASFCNAGFIGLPLVQNSLGNEAVFFIVSVIVQLNILQWTYGVYMLTKDKKNIGVKKILLNPVIIATLIGLVLFVSGITLPIILTSTINIVANLNTPIAMIICGVYLAQTNLYRIFTDTKVYLVSFVRLIVVPFVMLVLFYFIPVDGILKLALFIALITPVGANIAIFSHLFNKDYIFSVELICNSTILSVFTIPLWVSIYSLIIG